MISQEIRRCFLRYFKEKGHAALPSSPVVPHDDPSLLFINAGMNQFKDVFLGKAHRDYNKATTTQKCIRVGGKHNDLDNVGHTSRHLTFFEMLGNFSFGNYFKDQAIPYAWEVSTQIFKLDPEKIWITIFQDDEEAFELWKIIVPEKRIIRLGEKHNFWAMGETGPCGPCSELLYDRGIKYGDSPSPKEDLSGERYLEFWNLVFMQCNRDVFGKMSPLPQQSIDAGSGLERIVSLKMNVETVFATDILRSLIAQIEQVSGKTYDKNNREMAPAYHVIADHIRSLSFAIADGAQPSNIERGYVLRKLIRRAVRYGRMLGLNDPFLAQVLSRLIETMGEDYPELKTSQSRITEILTLEEEAFQRTLKRGGNILNAVITDAKNRPLQEITGKEAFKLKDTYGLPIEEILLIAKDVHLTINLDAYHLMEEKARQISRSAHIAHAQEVKESIYQDFLAKHRASQFLGDQVLEAEGTILGLIVKGRVVEELKEGEEGQIILNQTPFYAEKGGQIGDTGTLFHIDSLITVTDCQTPYSGLIVHQGKCVKGKIVTGDTVQASVTTPRRLLIQNNHTTTHLLHWVLQQVLGSHILQAGSVVDDKRIRFDFNHHKPLSQIEIEQIEDLVNEKIRFNQPIQTYEISYEEAQKRSDIKQFFGDKYGAKVRVIDIEFSKELCGGTHTTQTGTIGYFRIVKEGSIAAGVRRIEGVTGLAAEEFSRAKEKGFQLKITEMGQEHKKLVQQLKSVRRTLLREMAQTLVQNTIPIGSIPFLTAIVPLKSEELSILAEDLSAKLPSSVILLAIRDSDKCQLLLKVSPDLIPKGIQAVQIIKAIAPFIGGSGGGKLDSAQAGGPWPHEIEKAFEKVKELLQSVR